MLEDVYPDGIEETQLNDLLWFEPDWCLEMVGLKDEEEEVEESLDESKKGFKRKYKGCSIHDMGDVFVVTNEHGKNIGQSKTEAGCEAIIDDYLAKDESLKESKLTEKKWELELKAGAGLRDAIEDEDYKEVVEKIKDCYREINDKRPDLLDEDELDNIIEDLDVSFVEEEDFTEDNIDYYLNDLYDFCDNSGIWLNLSEELKEDTVKQNGKWVNKGKEGTHGKFKTKKAADAQRKAMFARGYKAKGESLKESEEDMEKVFVYQFPPLSVYDKEQLPKYNLEVSDIIETDFNDPDVEVKGKLKDLIRYGQDWLGGYELVKEYLGPVDEELKEDYEDFSDR